jgi:hypothetical protein
MNYIKTIMTQESVQATILENETLIDASISIGTPVMLESISLFIQENLAEFISNDIQNSHDAITATATNEMIDFINVTTAVCNDTSLSFEEKSESLIGMINTIQEMSDEKKAKMKKWGKRAAIGAGAALAGAAAYKYGPGLLKAAKAQLPGSTANVSAKMKAAGVGTNSASTAGYGGKAADTARSGSMRAAEAADKVREAKWAKAAAQKTKSAKSLNNMFQKSAS